MPRPQNIQAALDIAKQAGAKTRALLTNGNSNPYTGVPGTAMRGQEHLMKDEVLKMRALDNLSSKVNFDPTLYVLCNAAIAVRAKCGNCGEHASVAFALLFEKGISGIGKACYAKHDHAFVVIFAADGNWVICDPWADWYVPSNEWQKWVNHIWTSGPTASEPITIEASWDPPNGSTPRPSVSDYMSFVQRQFDVTPESMDLSK